jgi:hypothetical protein
VRAAPVPVGDRASRAQRQHRQFADQLEAPGLRAVVAPAHEPAQDSPYDRSDVAVAMLIRGQDSGSLRRARLPIVWPEPLAADCNLGGPSARRLRYHCAERPGPATTITSSLLGSRPRPQASSGIAARFGGRCASSVGAADRGSIRHASQRVAQVREGQSPGSVPAGARASVLCRVAWTAFSLCNQAGRGRSGFTEEARTGRLLGPGSPGSRSHAGRARLRCTRCCWSVAWHAWCSPSGLDTPGTADRRAALRGGVARLSRRARRAVRSVR